MKKSLKIISLIILVAIATCNIANVHAAQETIQLGNAPYVNERYIANVGFYHKQTTQHQELYCINIHKGTAKNTTATLVKNSSYVDGGVTYILKNGYPNKSITGNNDKDYYITQTAVWWYLDETHGTTNLGDQFKNNGTVTKSGQGMREIIRNLVNEAKQHKNDSQVTDGKLDLSSDNTMTLTDGYYTSNDIKATGTNVSTYTISITNAPSGTKIVKSDGTEVDYTNNYKLNTNETFKVKVPATAALTELTINASSAITSYKAYEYQPTNTNMQNVAMLNKETTNVSSATKLTVQNTKKVTITKVDKDTNQPLAGAVLVVKDATGNEVARFTTTESAYTLDNLSNGTYTIEEESAPAGYEKSNEKKTFTISDDNPTQEIIFANTKEEVAVPDTASKASIILTILGIVIISSGVTYVYKRNKKA